MVNTDQTFIINVSYRARGVHTVRRQQLIHFIENTKTYFTKHGVPFKIVISEQNNDKMFNRGLMLNVAFAESEKLFHDIVKTYYQTNVDYYINTEMDFPSIFLEKKKGFIELFKVNVDGILGSACIFDADSYKQINGFPNDLEGWGGDDWAIFNRIKHHNLEIFIPKDLHNKIIIEDHENRIHGDDLSRNAMNVNLARRNDSATNGLTTLQYTIDGHGEFHDGDTVFHYLVN